MGLTYSEHTLGYKEAQMQRERERKKGRKGDKRERGGRKTEMNTPLTVKENEEGEQQIWWIGKKPD